MYTVPHKLHLFVARMRRARIMIVEQNWVKFSTVYVKKDIMATNTTTK